MYEGYLQHDAQKVLQCILGYIQEACDTIRQEQELDKDNIAEVKTEDVVHLGSGSSVEESKTCTEEEGQVSGKRKSDTEMGNAKKKPKSVRTKKSEVEEEIRNKPLTRSKRRSSSDIITGNTQDKERRGKAEDEAMKKLNKEQEQGGDSENGEKESKEADGKKKKAKLSWLRPFGKQPSIFSKFCSVGKISCTTVKNQSKPEQENKLSEDQGQNETSEERPAQNKAEDRKAMKCQGMTLFP